MSQFPYQQSRRFELDYGTDAGITAPFFNAVYAWMCVGLAVSATVAYAVSHYAPRIMAGVNSAGALIALTLGLVVLSYAIRSAAMRMKPTVAVLLFVLYASILGAVLSYVFLIYSMTVLGAAFAITAGTFGAMSVIGFVTRRDLSKLGSILMMAVIGLVIASIVNFFVASSALSWLITYAVVIVFSGLVASDTQMLKQFAAANAQNPRQLASIAIVGALMLYLDFINLFVAIARILGDRR